jgi:hypothetical protein
VTTVHNSNSADPKTHVLAIGVGKYPHLMDGTGRRAQDPLGLGQLTSPPLSVKAFIEWCSAPELDPGAIGFCNPTASLGSIEAVVSSDPPLVIQTPRGPIQLDAATLDNIRNAFEMWLNRVASNDANVGIFYFCGHGVMVANHYLLAEDFGESDLRPWERAFDITNTLRGIERQVKGALYFFIDACKAISRDMALTLAADPVPLAAVDLKKSVVRSYAARIGATGEGELAFAAAGKVSRYTDALLTAMSGYCGIRMAGMQTWDVDGETLASAVRRLLDNRNDPTVPQQVIDQAISGTSVPLLRVGKPPKVKVKIDLSPEQKRSLALMYLLSAKGDRFEHDGANGAFRTEVQRGFYSIGARARAAEFAQLEYQDEEVSPPVFNFVMPVP